MLKRILPLVVMFLLPTGVWAGTETQNTVPQSNASFMTDLQNFLEEEDVDRESDWQQGYVVSGGTGPTDASLTHTIAAVTAYASGYYVNVGATAHTYTASRRTYVYLHKDDSTPASFSVTGGSGCTFDSRSENLVFVECDASSGTPDAPADSILLMRVDTNGSSITTVADRRRLTPVPPHNLDPCVNPKHLDHDAAGDGINDDAAAIQSAIDSLPSSGGRVCLPAGTYIVGSTLAIPANTVLSGEGRDFTTIELSSGAGADNIAEINGDNVEVYGIHFKGNGSSTGNDTGNGILADEVSDVVVRDCKFTNNGDAAVQFRNATATNEERFWVQRNVFQENPLGNSSAPDLQFNGGFSSVWITENDLTADTTSPANAAIDLGSTGGFFDDIHILNNRIRGAYEKIGISLGQSNPQDATVESRDVVIANNFVSDVKEQGIKTKNIARVTVRGNTVQNTNSVAAATQNSGISLNAYQAIVTDNRVVNSGGEGISIARNVTVVPPAEIQYGWVIANNIIQSPSTDGIVVQTEVQGVLIANNVVSECGEGGIQMITDTVMRDIMIAGNLIENCTSGFQIVGGDPANRVPHVTFDSNIFSENSSLGIEADQLKQVRVVNNQLVDNGATGLLINNVDDILVMGNRSGNENTADQDNGISVTSSATGVDIVRNDLRVNNTAALSAGGTTLPNIDGVVRANKGLVTEARGTATIANGTTAIVKAHGVEFAPTRKNIQVTACSDPNSATQWWLHSIGTAEFELRTNVDPGVNVQFCWEISFE